MISWKWKVVESSNLVKLVLRSAKNFSEKRTSKQIFDLREKERERERFGLLSLYTMHKTAHTIYPEKYIIQKLSVPCVSAKKHLSGQRSIGCCIGGAS